MPSKSKDAAMVADQAKEIVDSSTNTPKKRKDRSSGVNNDKSKVASAMTKNVERSGKRAKTTLGESKGPDAMVEPLKKQTNAPKTEEGKELANLMKFYLRKKPLGLAVTSASKEELSSEDNGKQAASLKRQDAFDRLAKNGLVEVAKEVRTIYYQLTETGVEAASSDKYKQDMAKEPTTTEELHERIIKYAFHPKTAKKMLDELVKDKNAEGKAISKKELAEKLGTKTSGPNFFYTLEQLKNQGYVQESKKKTLRLKKKAFVLIPSNGDDKPEEGKDAEVDVEKKELEDLAEK